MDSRTLSEAQQKEIDLITHENLIDGIKWYQRGFQEGVSQSFSIPQCPLLGSRFRSAYDLSLKAFDLEKLDETNPDHIRTLDLSYRYLLATKGSSSLEKVPMDFGSLNAKDFSYLKKIEQTTARHYGLTGYINFIKESNLGSAVGDFYKLVLRKDPVSFVGTVTDLMTEDQKKEFNLNLDRSNLETILQQSNGNRKKIFEAIIEKLQQESPSLDPSTLGLYTANAFVEYDSLTEKERKKLLENQAQISKKLDELPVLLKQFFEEFKHHADEAQQNAIQENEIRIRQEKFAHMQQTIKRGSAFASSIAYLAGNAEMGRVIGAFGDFTIQISTGMNEIMQAGSLVAAGFNPVLLIGTAILNLMSILSSSDEDGFGEALLVISKQLQQIQETLLTFRQEMHHGFNRVENRMDYHFQSLMHYMIDNFSKVKSDISKIKEFNNEIRNRLEAIVGKIDNLDRLIDRRDFEKSIANLDNKGSDYHPHYMENKHDARNWGIYFSKDLKHLGLEAKSIGEKITILKTPQDAMGLINDECSKIDSQGFRRNSNLANLNMLVESTSVYLGWITGFGKKIYDSNEIKILEKIKKLCDENKNYLSMVSKNKKIHEEIINRIKKDLSELKNKIKTIKTDYINDHLVPKHKRTLVGKTEIIDNIFETYDFYNFSEKERIVHPHIFFGSLSVTTDQRYQEPSEHIKRYKKVYKFNNRQFELEINNSPYINVNDVFFDEFNEIKFKPIISEDSSKRFPPILVDFNEIENKYNIGMALYAEFLGLGKVYSNYFSKKVRALYDIENVVKQWNGPRCDYKPNEICESLAKRRFLFVVQANENKHFDDTVDKVMFSNLPRFLPDAELKLYFKLENSDNYTLFSHLEKRNISLEIPDYEEQAILAKAKGTYYELLKNENTDTFFQFLAKLVYEKEIQYRKILSKEIFNDLTLNSHEYENILNRLNFNLQLLNSLLYLAHPELYRSNLIKIIVLNNWNPDVIKNELLNHDWSEDFFDKKFKFFNQIFDLFSEEILKQIDLNNLPGAIVKVYEPLSYISNELNSQIDFFKFNEKIEIQHQTFLKNINNAPDQCQVDNQGQCPTHANGAFHPNDSENINIVYDTDKRMAAARQSLSYQIFFLGMQAYKQTQYQALNLFEHAKNYMTQNKNSQTEIPQNSCETDCNQESSFFSDTQFKQANQIPLLNSKPQSALPYDKAVFDATPEFDPHTKQPIFTYRAFRENQEVGTIQFYGQVQYCFSKDGERNNTLNPTGVFKNVYIEKPLENQTPCKSLPLTEGEILWSAGISSAIYGGMRGCSNVVESGLRNKNVSATKAFIVKNALFYGSVFTLKMGEYAMQSTEPHQEKDYLQAMYYAALETGQLCLINSACEGFSKLSNFAANFLQNKKQNVAAKVCKTAGFISQYGLFAYQAASRPVKEMATSFVSGLAVQGVVEGVGKWVVKNKL